MKIEVKKKGFLWTREKKFKVTDWTPKAKPKLDVAWLNALDVDLRILQWDGGGILAVLGLYFLYVIECLGFNAHKFFKVFWGASTGSIVCAMICMGFSIKHVLQVYIELGSEIFQQRPFGGGLIGAKYKTDKLEAILKEYLGDTTFSQLYEKTGKELHVGVVNMTDEEPEIWNWQTHPNEPIRLALRMSCAAPIYFPPVEWRGKKYCDGGTGSLNCLAEKAYADAVYVKKIPASRIYIMSVGCGQAKIGLPKKNKLSQLLWFIQYGRQESIKNNVSFLKHRATDNGLLYSRLEQELPKKLDEMDNTDNIDSLIGLVDRP